MKKCYLKKDVNYHKDVFILFLFIYFFDIFLFGLQFFTFAFFHEIHLYFYVKNFKI